MSPIKMDAVVGNGGRVEFTVPLPAGTAVEVLVRDADVSEEDEAVEWSDQLQERLDALDRGEIDPRPWREAIEELRERLAKGRSTA
jgi:hypothetical protein